MPYARPLPLLTNLQVPPLPPCIPCKVWPLIRALQGAQYLFNVPPGFSRLVLEHQCRPGLGLRTAFLSGAHDTALVCRQFFACILM